MRGEVWKDDEQCEVKVNETVLHQLVSQGFEADAARVRPPPFCWRPLELLVSARVHSMRCEWRATYADFDVRHVCHLRTLLSCDCHARVPQRYSKSIRRTLCHPVMAKSATDTL